MGDDQPAPTAPAVGDVAAEPGAPGGAEGDHETAAPRTFPTATAAGVAVVAAALAWSYAPELRGLAVTWGADPNYSHGYLVVPLAVLILWRRLRVANFRRPEPWGWGWPGLALTLAARAVLHERGNAWGEVFTLLPAVACLTLTFGGLRLFRVVWPAVAYLVFMLPLPPRVDAVLALPLQRLATSATCSVLRVTGLWVSAEGNVIHIDAGRLEVANACNGLSMMVTLAATVTALILVLELRPWKQAVLLLGVVPVALASNVVRIAATAWCYHRLGASAGERLAHDAAGWLMMPLALALVGLELAALNWVVVEEVTKEEPLLLGRPIARSRAALGDDRRGAGGRPRTSAQGSGPEGPRPGPGPFRTPKG